MTDNNMRKYHDYKYLDFRKSCVDSTLRYNARKGKTRDASAFSRAGRLLIKKEPTFLG
jgi:hypothetical protein